jgi:hypothetical protein
MYHPRPVRWRDVLAKRMPSCSAEEASRLSDQVTGARDRCPGRHRDRVDELRFRFNRRALRATDAAAGITGACLTSRSGAMEQKLQMAREELRAESSSDGGQRLWLDLMS